MVHFSIWGLGIYAAIAVVSSLVTYFVVTSEEEQHHSNRSGHSPGYSRRRSKNSGNSQSKFSGSSHDDSCPICLMDFKEDKSSFILGCAHKLHEKCLKFYVKRNYKTCPLCKEQIHQNMINHILCNL